MNEPSSAAVPASARSVALARLLVYSLIGLVIFFVPFEIGGKSTIVLDHAASYLLKDARGLVIAIALLLMAYGALEPWVSGSWRDNAVSVAFSVLKVLGLAIGVAFLFKLGPEVVYAPGMLPFLFEKLVLSLALIVPLGSLALVFLKVPVSFLFDGGPSGVKTADGFSEGSSPAYVSDFLATAEGLALTRAFTTDRGRQAPPQHRRTGRADRGA